jgi:hypothetical protein
MKPKLHKGNKQDCPKCREVALGLEECFRLANQKTK